MGLTGGLATSIKPSFLPLTLLLIVMAAVVLHRRRVAWLAYVGWALLGLVLVGLVDLGFLLHYDALRGFLFILRVVTPTYTGMARESFWKLLSMSLPEYVPVLVLLTVAASVACWKQHSSWTWEQGAIAQGKPFAHHRYTLLVLLFLLIGYELLEALRQRGLPRWLAVAAFAWVVLRLVPMEMREVLHISRQMAAGQTPLTLQMESDLNRLGGTAALQDKVVWVPELAVSPAVVGEHVLHGRSAAVCQAGWASGGVLPTQVLGAGKARPGAGAGDEQ
jgi:hypothetical protein